MRFESAFKSVDCPRDELPLANCSTRLAQPQRKLSPNLISSSYVEQSSWCRSLCTWVTLKQMFLAAAEMSQVQCEFHWQSVPKPWTGDSEAPVAESGLCPRYDTWVDQSWRPVDSHQSDMAPCIEYMVCMEQLYLAWTYKMWFAQLWNWHVKCNRSYDS